MSRVQEIGEQTIDNAMIKSEGGAKLYAAASSTQYSNKRSTVMTAPGG